VRDNPTSTDGKVAGSAKRLAARFYQLKVGHCLTGEYLHWTKSRPTPQCWWCRCPKQTRHHLLKRCPRWKKEQRTLWEEVYKETGRGRERWKAHELFAESECSQSVLDFLSSTDVGKIVPAAEEDSAGSETSEWELRERREREEEREAEAEALGAEDGGDDWKEHRLFLPTPSFMASAEDCEGTIPGRFLLFFPLIRSFAIFLVRRYFSRDRPGRRAKGA